jgi:Predicted hydrolases of the HAD superfamily
MKYKLIAADFDDTILHSNMTFSDYFVRTVKDYESAGGKFIVVTGRMTASIIPYCKEMGLKGEVISYQGAAIADIETGEHLETTPIPLEEAVEMTSYLEKRGIYHHVYEGGDMVVNDPSPFGEMYAKLARCGVKTPAGRCRNTSERAAGAL